MRTNLVRRAIGPTTVNATGQIKDMLLPSNLSTLKAITAALDISIPAARRVFYEFFLDADPEDDVIIIQQLAEILASIPQPRPEMGVADWSERTGMHITYLD